MALAPEILATLEAAPAQLSSLFRQVPAGALRWVPDSWEGIPGERFCFADQMCHIRDIEVDGYQVRIRRIVEEDLPEASYRSTLTPWLSRETTLTEIHLMR